MASGPLPITFRVAAMPTSHFTAIPMSESRAARKSQLESPDQQPLKNERVASMFQPALNRIDEILISPRSRNGSPPCPTNLATTPFLTGPVGQFGQSQTLAQAITILENDYLAPRRTTCRSPTLPPMLPHTRCPDFLGSPARPAAGLSTDYHHEAEAVLIRETRTRSILFWPIPVLMPLTFRDGR